MKKRLLRIISLVLMMTIFVSNSNNLSVQATQALIPAKQSVPLSIEASNLIPTHRSDGVINLTPNFENIVPYTVGSNQEWGLRTLSQLDNSAEKIRLYNFLLRAHTYLLIYDRHDYIDEYNFVKNLWLDFLEEIPSEQIRHMLDDENWTIDISYPLETPFNLNNEEFVQTYHYFQDANPQFFLTRTIPVTIQCDVGLTPWISISAYWAFADRRQDAYNNIQDMFNDFKSQMHNDIDVTNPYHVVRYVHRHVIEALNYNLNPDQHVRQNLDMELTILGYFSDLRLTACKGHAVTIMYMLNRLGIPTINQTGITFLRDSNKNIGSHMPHAWNIVQLNRNWYALDATGMFRVNTSRF